jgi:hypothetical protein
MIGSGMSSGVSVHRRQHRAGLVVEPVLGAGVADVLDDLADDFLKIDVTAGRDLAGNDRQAGRHERFACDACNGILRQDGIEHAIGNLIGNLVGMSFSNGFGRKKMAATPHCCLLDNL